MPKDAGYLGLHSELYQWVDHRDGNRVWLFLLAVMKGRVGYDTTMAQTLFTALAIWAGGIDPCAAYYLVVTGGDLGVHTTPFRRGHQTDDAFSQPGNPGDVGQWRNC